MFGAFLLSTDTVDNNNGKVFNNSISKIGTCEDKIDCLSYGLDACHNKVYEPWLTRNCARFCGFCEIPVPNISECIDALANCHEYDSGTLCTDPTFYVWAHHNCKGYCGFDRCNETCTDNSDIDCARYNEQFNICSDATKAHACRRFCGFCSSRDGGWSEWGSWNGCDVTCGTGTRHHVRTCTNPVPRFGLPCQGNNSETGVCTLVPCPVNGGWSGWGVWGSCSATCDVGIQKRMRSCTNPAPAYTGNHCFGEPSNYRVCNMPACADGVWSSWESWNACIVSCGGGTKRRQRHCTNPAPSLLGRYCDGSSELTSICNNSPCPITNGGWSSWERWSTCSASCGGGVQRRHRNCNNPTPSVLGRTCAGTNEQTNICNSFNCYAQVRLAGSNATNQGRVEVFLNGQWGTICDDGFDDTDANVVCSMLGFGNNGGVAMGSAYFGSGSSSSPIILDDLVCDGSEHSIFDCSHREFGTNNCGHTEDAGVICTLNGKIRLSGSSTASYYKGRVEVFLNDQWGTVCDDSFDNDDAMVVCHMLGFKRSGAVAKSDAYFGEGSSSLPIQLDDVSCSGREQSMVDCNHTAIGTHDCTHSEDAGVICQLY